MSIPSNSSTMKKPMNPLFNSPLMSSTNFEDFLHNSVLLPAAEPAIIETKPQQNLDLDHKGKFLFFWFPEREFLGHLFLIRF